MKKTKKERQLQVAAHTEFVLRLDLVLVVVLVIVFFMLHKARLLFRLALALALALAHRHTGLVLVPGLATHPLQSIAGLIRANLDAGTLSSAHCFLHLSEREEGGELVCKLGIV